MFKNENIYENEISLLFSNVTKFLYRYYEELFQDRNGTVPTAFSQLFNRERERARETAAQIC